MASKEVIQEKFLENKVFRFVRGLNEEGVRMLLSKLLLHTDVKEDIMKSVSLYNKIYDRGGL